MRLKKDSSEQKLRGAYYTPLRLANEMVSLFASENIKTVLEPSCGDGVFIDSLFIADLWDETLQVQAVEINNIEAQKVSDRYKNKPNINILCEDFFDFYQKNYINKKYDLILGNPPYIRYQYLTEEQRKIQSDILTTHGMKSNKLINAWVAFVVACVQMLSTEGKIAFVLPAEILQVAYAEDLRLYLSAHLQKITLITFEELVFPDIEQEVVVFIGEKGEEEKGIRIIEMQNLDDFDTLDLNRNNFQKLQHVKEKWTKYFVTSEEMTLINKIKSDNRFFRFDECALINVGITTGNNKYFSITDETCKEYELADITLPLIGRSSHLHGVYFTNSDWEINRKRNKRARLVYFPEIPFDEYPEKHKKYIELGEQAEEHKGYKCSIRDRWYIVPSVWVPDAFFLRRNNLYPKFVLNHCNAVSTDTTHRIKFYESVDPELILLSYYNSISFAFTEICGRSYGGGVLEILPGEVGNVMLPKIESLPINVKKEIIKRIDNIIRNDLDIEDALDIVDKEILIDLLDVKPEWCSQCRNVWRKLQKRRLSRS